MRVMNDTVGSSDKIITGHASISMVEDDMAETRMYIEADLLELLSIVQQLQNHRAIRKFEIQEQSMVKIPSRLFKSFKLHLPSHYTATVYEGQSLPSLLISSNPQNAGKEKEIDKTLAEQDSTGDDVKAEICRLEAWHRSQTYIPTPETLQTIAQQNDMLRESIFGPDTHFIHNGGGREAQASPTSSPNSRRRRLRLSSIK